jgi:hypothetical protein
MMLAPRHNDLDEPVTVNETASAMAATTPTPTAAVIGATTTANDLETMSVNAAVAATQAVVVPAVKTKNATKTVLPPSHASPSAESRARAKNCAVETGATATLGPPTLVIHPRPAPTIRMNKKAAFVLPRQWARRVPRHHRRLQVAPLRLTKMIVAETQEGTGVAGPTTAIVSASAEPSAGSGIIAMGLAGPGIVSVGALALKKVVLVLVMVAGV